MKIIIFIHEKYTLQIKQQSFNLRMPVESYEKTYLVYIYIYSVLFYSVFYLAL